MKYTKGTSPWNKGTKGVMKKNISSFKKGMIPWNKGKKSNTTPWNKGIKCLNISLSKMNHEVSPETRKKISLANKGRILKHDKQFKKGMMPWNKGKKGVQKPSIESIKRSLCRNPMSSLEMKTKKIIENNHLPFVFVGAGELFIGKKCPDFVHSKGKKVAVEVFYRRHKDLFRGGTDQWMEERRTLFENEGWEVLFFDETEVQESTLTKRLGEC